MTLFRSRLQRSLHIALAVCLVSLVGPSRGLAQESEPIAYVGHGAFFDGEGNRIRVTLEFVARAQAWYRTKLLAGLNASQKDEFANFERRLNDGLQAEGQARLLVEHRQLEWLVANSKEVDSRIVGKLNALKYALNWKLPERADLDQPKGLEEFTIDPELAGRLKQTGLDPGGAVLVSGTLNVGQAYIDQCTAADVPIPPPIGLLDPTGLNGWKSQGFIPTSNQFIGQERGASPAEVRTFQSSSPPGMCIALPRYTNDSKTIVAIDGVICLGQSSKVCFWDNQMNRVGFPFASGTKIPIGVPDLAINPAGQYQAGGFELERGSGGVCTDCHAGHNPYIIHPMANLEVNDVPTGVLMGSLNLPTSSLNRYDPLVPASWPQNQYLHPQARVPAECSGCHSNSGSGGAFPNLSPEIQGYCYSILANSIGNATTSTTRPMPTMPKDKEGQAAANPGVKAFQDYCEPVFLSGVTGNPAFIQGTFDTKGNFEVVVPQGDLLTPFYRENDIPLNPWRKAPSLPPWPGAAKPLAASMIQSNFGNPGGPGNLELISRMRNVFGGNFFLASYFRVANVDWNGPSELRPDGQGIDATGDPGFIQSTFGVKGNFELVVPEGDDLVYYSRDNDAAGLPWHKKTTLPRMADARPLSVSLIQSNYAEPGQPGNLELIAHMTSGVFGGDFLAAYFRDANSNWHGPTPIVADGLRITGVWGKPAFIQGRFGTKGNFEMIVPHSDRLVHYSRDNDDPATPWYKLKTLPQIVGASPWSAAMIQSNFAEPGQPGNLEVIARMSDLLTGEFLAFYYLTLDGTWHGPFNLSR